MSQSVIVDLALRITELELLLGHHLEHNDATEDEALELYTLDDFQARRRKTPSGFYCYPDPPDEDDDDSQRSPKRHRSDTVPMDDDQQTPPPPFHSQDSQSQNNKQSSQQQNSDDQEDPNPQVDEEKPAKGADDEDSDSDSSDSESDKSDGEGGDGKKVRRVPISILHCDLTTTSSRARRERRRVSHSPFGSHNVGQPVAKKPKKKKPQTEEEKEAALDEEADERALRLLPDKSAAPPTQHSLASLLDRFVYPYPLTNITGQNKLIEEFLRGYNEADDLVRVSLSRDTFLTLLQSALLDRFGLGSKHRVTTADIVAKAKAAAPGQTEALLELEKRIVGQINTYKTQNYLESRVALCDLIGFERKWSKLSNHLKGVHNRTLYIAAHEETRKFKKARAKKKDIESLCAGQGKWAGDCGKWVRKYREPLTYARTQISNLFDLFGFVVLLHPSVRVENLGRPSASLTRLTEALKETLRERRDLQAAIASRDKKHLNILKKLIREFAVPSQTDDLLYHLDNFIASCKPFKY
uniref:Uncharacterized protein n=1 Tax=Mycena chlorophos TaxID=658473 RepID=A0ABQ0LAQ0_MYCCL|nr:predicted protein [Mycena chlorophos]